MNNTTITESNIGKSEEFGKHFIYVIFAFWAGSEVLLNSKIEKILWWNTSDINDHMAVVILILLMIQIALFQKYTFHELIMIGLLSVPVLCSTVISGNNIMMSTWIFIIAVKCIDFDRVIRISYYIELAALILVVYLFATGFVSEVTTYRCSMVRHSLGFSHPNQLGIRVFLLIVCRCYVRRDKFNVLDWLLIIAAAIFVKLVPDSKTSFYALIILAVIMALYEFVRLLGGDLGKLVNIMIVVAILANALSIVLSLISVKNHPVLNRFDRMMSFRFSACHKTFQYYGVKIFGQKIELILSRPGIGRVYHFWLDNAYMSILLRYGIVTFVLFSALYIWTMVMLKKKEQYLLVAILCLYALYGIMENNYFSMSKNHFLLLLSYPIYHQSDLLKKSVAPSAKLKISW